MTEYIVENVSAHDEAIVEFHDLGKVVLDEYRHRFTSNLMQFKDAWILKHMLEIDERLQQYSPEITLEKTVFRRGGNTPAPFVIHIEAPLEANNYLNDFCYVESQASPLIRIGRKLPDEAKKLINTTHRVNQLRWTTTITGDKYVIDSDVVKIIKKADELTTEYKNRLSNLRGIRGYKRRDALQKFRNNVESDLEELNLAERVNVIFNSNGEPITRLTNKDLSHIGFEVHIPSLDVFEYTGFITSDEFRNQRLVFLDIENPFYKNDEEPSWVGINYFENGRIVRREILTTEELWDIELHNANGTQYHIAHSLASFEELKDMTEDRVSQFNPFAIVGQNILDYDLEELGIFKDKLILDLYKVGRPALSFLPSLNLDTNTQFIFGGFKKGLSYDEMPKLVQKIRDANKKDASGEETRKGREAALAILNYQGLDVDVMAQYLYNSSNHKNKLDHDTIYSLDDLLWVADNFRIDLNLLLRNPTNMSPYLKRKFWEDHHIFQEMVFFNRDKENSSYRRRVVNFKNRLLTKIRSHVEDNDRKIESLPENTMITYFPWPDYLIKGMVTNKQDYFFQSHPEMSDFIKFKYPEGRIENPLRQLYLSKVLEKLLFPIISYAEGGTSYGRKPKDENKARIFRTVYGFDPEHVFTYIDETIDFYARAIKDKGGRFYTLLAGENRERKLQYSYLHSNLSEQQIIENGLLPLISFSEWKELEKLS